MDALKSLHKKSNKDANHATSPVVRQNKALDFFAEPRNGVHSFIFCQNMFIIIVSTAKTLAGFLSPEISCYYK